MKAMKILFLVMILSLVIAFAWDSLSFVKDSVHAVLNPSFGKLLDWNVNIGMILIVGLFSIITTIVQKYGTDQETLRELKKEQRLLKEEADKFKHDPEKYMELSKKQFEFVPKTMDITMRPLMYTFIPFVLFFRWFHDYFTETGVLIFGFMSWIVFYLIVSIIFSMIFRKIFKVV